MRLITPYAPGSFLKPVVIVSTIFATGGEKETALCFCEALNAEHALQIFCQPETERPFSKVSEWVVIKQHTTRRGAIAFHLATTKHFDNGGSQKAWDAGWEPYLALYERWCPVELRDKYGVRA